MNNKKAYNKNYIKNNKSTLKKFVLFIFIVALAILSFYVFDRYKNRQKLNDSVTKTTSSAPSAQDDFTGAEERPVLETPTEDKGSASITDNQGTIESTPSEEQWIVSKTGEITVYTPSVDQLLKSGNTLSGESALSIISYRVIDNISGVINEGKLSVVNGKFSGTISFTTTATEGRLDIYSSKEDGVEFSNIEIPVRFK
ncbi:MAG: hypothetical protein Q7T41_03055 [Candidatus Saccharibacteria bacterium]|nr:hypothetical protein [Candidatus Saccharibacteria bacterium]